MHLHMRQQPVEWRTPWSELFLFWVLGFVIMEIECKCTIYATERAKSWAKRLNLL